MSTHLLGYGLGRGLGELGSGSPPNLDVPLYPQIISIAADIFTVGRLVRLQAGTAASGTYQVANCPTAYPFYLPRQETVYQLGWWNGSSAGDNADVGIYDANWTRLVSTGSTTGSGNTSPQFVDVADTTLSARTLYYLVVVRDTTTANRIRRFVLSSGAGPAAVGVYTTGTSQFPLPDPLASMSIDFASSLTNIPDLLMAVRSSPA